jgi:hypothetical protein
LNASHGNEDQTRVWTIFFTAFIKRIPENPNAQNFNQNQQMAYGWNRLST